MSFWNKYYSNKINGDNLLKHDQSSFAEYCAKYFKPSSTLIDLGCGNGRDSKFFSNTMNVIAVDNSETALQCIDNDNIKKINNSVDNLPQLEVDVCYSRFSLHSITLKQQDKLLKWCFNNLSEGGLLCIETRSVNDPRYGIGKDVGDNAYIDTHYRRFMTVDFLKNALLSLKFKIKVAEEDYFSAHHNNDKAVVIRIIAEK